MLEKNSESKYVLFTPVGGNDPVGDEYYKDDMIEEINKKLVEGKISQDKADKLITYIESKRNKEPILMEGAILHIVRHYKPDCVILVFTNTVKEVEIKYNVLSEKIKELSKSCEVLKIEDFNKDYVYSWEYNIDFNEKLKNIPEKYSKHNILVNITSSTPQMNLKLSLETLNNYKLIPVQVLVSLNDLHTGKNVQKDFSKVYSDYEEIIKRCVEPNIYSIRKPKIKSQIHSLIASGDIDENGKYNYITAYNLFKNDRHIRKDLIKKIEEAKERVNLNYTNNRKIEEDKLKYMNIFREYYFVMKIKKIKGEMSDFILRITPFITELFYYFLSNLNIKDLKDVFIKNKNESYINVFEIKNNTLKNEIFYTKLRNYIKHAKLENKYKNIQYLSLDIKNIDTMIEDLYKKIEVLFLKLKNDNNGFKDLFKIAASLYGSIKNPTFNKYKIIDNIKDLMKYKDKSDEVNDICNSYNKIKSKREILDIADKYVSKNDYATIQYLLIIFKYYNNNYLSIYNLFKEFRDIESKVRNNIAHNLISITEDDIIYNVGLSSDRILYKCDELFQLIFKNDLSPADIGEDGRLKFDYNCIINKDIETLLIDPIGEIIMIEKYVLFSPVGFNDAVGNKLNIDLVKNKLNYDLKNNNLPAYNDKIKSMLEYLNVNSEINTEGTILSIVRKYKPKKVLLLFTPEMIIKENKDSVNIFDILEKEITKRSSECIVEKKLIKYHNTFDADIMSNEGETFYDMINDLKRDYEDYKILVNITSSTAQIKTRIALECVETNFNIIPIYLSDPLRSKISTSAIQYFAPSSEEYKEPVRSNILDRLDKIDTIWDEYEDYTIYRENNIINDDIYYKKYSVAKLSILVQNRIKSQIAALIERSYEYKTCYELFKDNDFIKENFQDVLILLRYADFRVKLKYSDDELKKENINLDADCLKYFQDKLNSFDNAEKILIEYFYLMKLKQKKGDLSDFILMLTPFLENIKYCKDKKLISSLNKIENKLRNTAAHQMVNVSEEDILKKCNISSKDIINKCSALLKLIFMKKFDEKYFVYDEINKRILEKL